MLIEYFLPPALRSAIVYGYVIHYEEVSASIYGIVIMFLCLQFKIIRLSAVEETGKFLIEIMPVMFIPAAVELMESFQIIKASCLQYAVIIVVSTVLVMAVSGRVTQFVAHHKDKGVKQND